MERYTCSKFEELQKIYSILRKKNHKLKINVEFNDNTKKYTIYQSNEPFEGDPEVPIDLDIKVIYGDSVTGDTPLLLRNPETNYVHIETISSIFDVTKKVEYPGFKIFDKSIRLEKEYSTTNYQIWTDIGWVNINRVIRHRCDKKIYRVLTHTGCVDVTEDHSLLTRDLQPIKPNELEIDTELSHTFPTEFNETTFEKDIVDKEFNNLFTKEFTKEFTNKLEAHRYFYFYKRLGYSVILSTCINSFRLTFYNYKSIFIYNFIKIIELNKTNDYVYDIETEIGRFGVGIGELQVSNTDSVFLKFKYNRDDYTKNREDTFRLGNLCGELFTNEVVNRNPIELEFEKIFQPFILLTKKRYIANKYEDTKNPMKLAGNDIKGVALTRRDYCLMVKKCYQEVIDCLLDYTDTNDIEENVNKSIKLFKTTIQKIDKYEIEIDNLIISGKLAKSYKSKPAHALLADKLKERNEEVQIGDRIQYIFIENTTDDKLKKTELAEDPVYAKEHKLYYNRAAYLEQLAKPILGIYKVILQNDSELLDKLIDYVNFYLVDKYNNKKLNKSDFTIKDE